MMVAAMAVISCTTTELDPLKGIYPEAKEPALTTLAESSCSKTETTRVFKLMFTGDATLEAYLVGARNQYYLESNVYGPGESNGCFLTDRTRIDGKAVKSGNITVQRKDNDHYKFVFVLFDTDGNPYRTKWEGTLVYEPDPEAVKLTEVLQAQANANNTVTVKLGTAGMSVDMMGTPSGDGFALTADLYSDADLKLDIQATGLADESFDVIVCNHVLEHVDDFRIALKELHRLLCPGGSLICSFPMILFSLTWLCFTICVLAAVPTGWYQAPS